MARVMIVDDDRDFVDSICRLLERMGQRLTALYDTAKVIEVLEREPYDLLILDVMFPEDPAAGFALAQQIRKHQRLAELPILILSAINTRFPVGFGPGDIDEVWMPVQDFLEKLIDFDAFLSKVESLSSSQSAIG